MREAFYEHYVSARLLLSRIANWPIFKGASHKLYPGRFAHTHELSPLMGHHGETKASLLLGVGAFGRPLQVTTDKDHPEIGSLAVIGRSRCGKGLLAKSQLLTWPHSVIVNDIKGDLYHDTAGYRSLFSDIKVIDTRGVGNRYDPFTNRHTEEELRALAQYLLCESNEGHGKAFTDRGIRILLQLFKAARIEELRPFPYAAHFVHLGFNDTIARLDAVSQKAGLPPHKNLARRVLDDDGAEGHAEGVFLQDAWSTMISKLEPVITENVLKTVSGSDFTAQDIMCGKKPVTLYLRWPEAHVDAQAPLIRLIVSTLFDDLKTIYDERRGKGCREILWILDEAGRAPVPKLPEYASTVLGRKITLWIAYQSRSQPEKIYGSKGADELFDNIDSILYYRPAIGNYKSGM
jgi:type IV secretion system protein VirD4